MSEEVPPSEDNTTWKTDDKNTATNQADTTSTSSSSYKLFWTTTLRRQKAEISRTSNDQSRRKVPGLFWVCWLLPVFHSGFFHYGSPTHRLHQEGCSEQNFKSEAELATFKEHLAFMLYCEEQNLTVTLS